MNKEITQEPFYCTECDLEGTHHPNGMTLEEIARIHSDIQKWHRLVCPKAEIKSGFRKEKRPLSSITDADAKEHIRRYHQVALNQQLTTASLLQDFFSREVARLKKELARLG